MTCEILLDRINQMPEQSMTPALARIRENLIDLHRKEGGKTTIKSALKVLNLIELAKKSQK